jgi:hypothetical protein
MWCRIGSSDKLFLNLVMNVEVPLNAGNFLSSQVTVIFPRRTVLPEDSLIV